MFTLTQVHANLYKDSVALMRVAQSLLALPDIHRATLQMGTQANKAILAEAGLLTEDAQNAAPSDVMVVVVAKTSEMAKAALGQANDLLMGTAQGVANNNAGVGLKEIAPRTLGMGLARLHTANIAQISVPGAYAAAEALKAVKAGLNVFMFSDNVPLEQEVALKQEAQKRNVLVMGPDCGTALIGGVPLGFANAVRRGNIGLVAASGTGLQEVTTQIHRMGAGVSHAIGTGGRDVYAEVGGITLLQGIDLLAQDADTKVIAIVSKPPAPEVTTKVYAALEATGKPAVVLFLGSDAQSPSTKIKSVKTLVDCAAVAVRLSKGAEASASSYALHRDAASTQPHGDDYRMPPRPKFAPGQKFLRALYSGGTYCSEAQILWVQAGLSVHSNIPVKGAWMLDNPKSQSVDHTALDLGDDAFTVGKPHPMIDQGARIERLLKEAADPSVAVVVLDVVIGWGAHANPAGELSEAIQKARAIAQKDGRVLAVVGFVCGTDLDPQGLLAQEVALHEAGMVLAPNSASAAWLAQQWVSR